MWMFWRLLVQPYAGLIGAPLQDLQIVIEYVPQQEDHIRGPAAVITSLPLPFPAPFLDDVPGISRIDLGAFVPSITPGMTSRVVN